MPLSRHVETKTQSPSSGVGCLLAHLLVMPPGAVRRSSRLSSRPSARPACLPHMPCVVSSSHPLIISPARPRSSHPLHTGSAACLIPFASLIGSSARPCLVSLCSPLYRQAGRGGDAILIGGRTSAAEGGRSGSWLLACPGGDWRGGSVISSPHLIGSSNRLRPPRSSNHLIIPSTGRGFLFLFARPPPACSSRFAYRGLFPRPRPGDVGLRDGLRRRACGLVRLLAVVSVPLSHCVRSLVAICLVSLASLCLLGALWGVLRNILTAYLSALAFLNICP